MKVLVACEESQTVCKEFRVLGHEAYSCDIVECSGGHSEWHLKQNVIPLLKEKWDLIIAHPPCTYLSNAGLRWFNEKKYGEKAVVRKQLRLKALDFFMFFVHANSKHICIENPVGWLNSHYRKPDQIYQPYYFGETESKRTCLWLFGLLPLKHTGIVKPKIYGYYKKGKNKGSPIYGNNYYPFNKDRVKIRSKTPVGVARAMAAQWGYMHKSLVFYLIIEVIKI